MPITTTSIIAANVAVMLGAILQASTGLGAGLIIVPLLALVSLAFVPGPLVLASMALSGLMAFQGRREIDGRGLPLLLANGSPSRRATTPAICVAANVQA
jgi:uncharacterized membrane protein YfcA